jgi:hypothetical protein
LPAFETITSRPVMAGFFPGGPKPHASPPILLGKSGSPNSLKTFRQYNGNGVQAICKWLSGSNPEEGLNVTTYN